MANEWQRRVVTLFVARSHRSKTKKKKGRHNEAMRAIPIVANRLQPMGVVVILLERGLIHTGTEYFRS
jgi:hypothetical protein